MSTCLFKKETLWSTWFADDCCVEAVIDDCTEHGKILKELNSPVSLLHYASVTCCQFCSGANGLIIAQFSISLKLCFWWQMKPLIQGMKLIRPLDHIYVNWCANLRSQYATKITTIFTYNGFKLLLSVTLSGLWVMSSNNEALLISTFSSILKSFEKTFLYCLRRDCVRVIQVFCLMSFMYEPV